MAIVYVNGQWLPKEQAMVSVFDCGSIVMAMSPDEVSAVTGAAAWRTVMSPPPEVRVVGPLV